MIVRSVCRYCKGTGDWRGEYGKKMFDYRAKVNYCLHCDGTGILAEEKNCCKYCGEPCNGYFCDSCGNAFEREREMEVVE